MNRPWHSFYPEEVPYELELPSMTVYDLLKHSANEYPNHKAIINGDHELTYAELKNASDRFACALYSRGFKKGDRIGLMLPNSTEYVVAYFAVHRLGGIGVQISPLYQSSELNHLLSNSGARWLVCHQNQIEKLDKIGMTGDLTIIIADGSKEQENSFYQWIDEASGEAPEANINPVEDVAMLQYTGGTTGMPKGVMLTHSNLVSNACQHSAATNLEKNNEILLGNSPVTHVMGMNYLNVSIFAAGTYLVIDRFRVEPVLELIRKHKPTIFVGAPTIYISLLQYPHLGPDELKCLKVCTCGSAPLPVEVIREFEAKSGAKILEGFGMSETLTTHRNPLSNNRKTGSVGFPFPNTDCKVVDKETGTNEMPIGVPGELIVKGPQVMKGYWQNDEATKSTLRDGWLYTGDIAIMDEDGYFFIVGRKKEMIIASGYNIYPIEVEEVLYQHPAIVEACVFGVPDSYRGETVKAAIVTKKDATLTEDEVIKWCKERLATYKVPRIIEFSVGLPKSPAGKILKRKLMEERKAYQG